MRALNRNNKSDRQIVAFYDMIFLKDLERGRISVGTIWYNCWGEKVEGIHKFTTTPEYFAKYGGTTSLLTLELAQAGCCPPQLMKEFLEQEGMTAD